MSVAGEGAQARAALRSIERDPVSFCRTLLRFEPWSRQRQVLESVRDHERTAVRSCHGAGKTAVAARAALWFLCAHPHARVITTAPTWAQVKQLLWRELRAAYSAAAGFLGGTLSETRLELADDWFAVGLSTDRPERFQGHHAEHLLLVVDEASGVEQAIFEAAEGFLTGPGARLLLIGNPTQTAGEFYEAFHRQRALYQTIAISAYDTPAFSGEALPEQARRKLVTRAWVEAARRKWGEGSPVYQVRVLGQFPSQADDSVIGLAAVELAQRRSLPPGEPAVVACDVARFGSDETVIAIRRGQRLRIANAYSGRDTMQTVGAILTIARRLEAEAGLQPRLVIDDAGLGGGVTDRLRELHEFPLTAFTSASAAHKREDYPNRRSEAWFCFADRLGELDLDRDEQLAADLVAPRYTLDSQGRRTLEPKEHTKRRLGRSPDRADAAIMAFAINPAAGVWTPRTPSAETRAISAGLADKLF